MRSPKTLAWLYLIVGILGVVGAVVYLLIDYGRAESSWMLFDAVLLAMGGYGIYMGIKGFRALAAKPGDTTPGAKPGNTTSAGK